MRVLTDDDVNHFLRQNYVVIRNAFPKDVAAEWAASGYHRLGIDPADRSTWKEDRVHMGGSKSVEVKSFAPRAYDAILDICGEGRIVEPLHWSDHFIVNLQERHDQPWIPPGPEAPHWHKDGDFFRHFLDSPEQGLLVFVCWTDVVHQGGPTYVAPDSVRVVAEFLRDRPEGVLPGGFGFRDLISQCKQFEEVEAEAGDVFLLHPFVLHTVSQNIKRVPRIITNPPVSMREPLRFRGDGLNLIERGILNALGVDELAWEATGPRERIVPERVRRQQERNEAEAAAGRR